MNETVTSAAEPRTASPDAEAAADKVLATLHGAVAALTLNRPKALNAFDDDMRRVFADTIPRIARNPDVYVVVLKSTSPKAFCAGGDVRALIAAAARNKAEARSYFAGEYKLDWLLDCFSKPTISFIDGLCMGSGAGLTLYNTHRVAGENYKFAMPETAIGLFPDVGVAHELAKLPWPIGLYLGLTGRMIGRADAHWLGLATHCIDSAHFSGVVDKLAASEPIDPLLDDLHEPQPPGPLQAEQATIEEFFSSGSMVEIMAKLKGATGASEPFAKTTLADLERRSPLSLVLTERHIRTARSLDLREMLIQDYRLAVRCLDGNDFAEGVRAALIDKDGAPRWQHAAVEDVTEAEVTSYFAALGDDDLVLPARVDMQSARV